MFPPSVEVETEIFDNLYFVNFLLIELNYGTMLFLRVNAMGDDELIFIYLINYLFMLVKCLQYSK